MKRNKKFYQHKELLRLKREENKFFEVRRNEYKKKIKVGTGRRPNLSKKLCPNGIYNDLKIVIDMIAKEFNSILSDKEYNSYYIQDPMLKELSEEQYNNLPTASREFLDRQIHSCSNIPTEEEIEYYTYTLKEDYFYLLYNKKVPVYRNHYFSYWNWNNSEYEELRYKIDSNNLRPKMCKAASRAYYNGHKDEWNEYKRNILDKEYKKQMKQDINDYYEERGGIR